MTVRKAADIAQVAPSTLQEWKANAAPSDFQAIRRLATHFEVSMAYLLTGEEDTPHRKPPDVADVLVDGGEIFNGYLEVKSIRQN